MAEGRLCLACGSDLAGPFLPQIDLAQPSPAEEAGGGAGQVQITAHSWVCLECGLVHWYAEEQEPEAEETADTPAAVAPRPGSSYERRSEILRMLRRVKRM
jgi:hypothetical protein